MVTLRQRERGATYLALLLAIAFVTAVLASTATVWSEVQRREREKQLLWAGDQFRKALAAYSRFGNGTYPRRLEDLLEDSRSPAKRRYLRQIYEDPMTRSTDWGLVRNLQGGIIAVYSRHEGAPIKTAHFPPEYDKFERARTYADWQFAAAKPLIVKEQEPPAKPRAATAALRPAAGSTDVLRPAAGTTDVLRPAAGTTDVLRPAAGGTDVLRPGPVETPTSPLKPFAPSATQPAARPAAVEPPPSQPAAPAGTASAPPRSAPPASAPAASSTAGSSSAASTSAGSSPAASSPPGSPPARSSSAASPPAGASSAASSTPGSPPAASASTGSAPAGSAPGASATGAPSAEAAPAHKPLAIPRSAVIDTPPPAGFAPSPLTPLDSVTSSFAPAPANPPPPRAAPPAAARPQPPATAPAQKPSGAKQP